jgi:hypothetical protein
MLMGEPSPMGHAGKLPVPSQRTNRLATPVGPIFGIHDVIHKVIDWIIA